MIIQAGFGRRICFLAFPLKTSFSDAIQPFLADFSFSKSASQETRILEPMPENQRLRHLLSLLKLAKLPMQS